jgi:hypothetical protein
MPGLATRKRAPRSRNLDHIAGNPNVTTPTITKRNGLDRYHIDAVIRLPLGSSDLAATKSRT